MLILFGFIALAHTIIYLAAVAAWPPAWPIPSISLEVFLGVFAVGSVAVLMISSRYNNMFAHVLYRIFAVWMGFFGYFFLAAFAYGTFLGVTQARGIADTFPWVGQILGLVALIGGLYGLFHAQRIRVKHMDLTLPNLPEFWKGKRAVFLSDIHLGHVHTSHFAHRVVQAVNAVEHDIILIGGDLYDGVKVDEHAIIAPLAALKPRHGVYFVTGNHEEFTDSARFLTAIRGLGFKVLMNELVDIEGLQIIGMTDQHSIDKAKLAETLGELGIDRSRPSIFLKHQPSHVEIPHAAGVSIQLSGHTHRAQQFPLNFFPYLIYKGYSYGMKRFKDMHVYTSSGVGSWGPPMRVGSDSEIVVFTLS